MGTKRTLVVIHHDTGYGGDLLRHMNDAFSGKDMIAERIVEGQTAIVIQTSRMTVELATGDVTKDGAFLLSEEGTDSVHIGWWDESLEDWTIESKQAGFDVGKLTPIAKIITRKNITEEVLASRVAPLCDHDFTDWIASAKTSGVYRLCKTCGYRQETE